MKRLACVPCTRSKRRCSKDAPSCVRCLEKSIPCHYPAPRVAPPYNLVYSEDGEISAIVSQPNESSAPRFERFKKKMGPSSTSPSTIIPPTPGAVSNDVADNPWFLSPQSWDIDHKHEVMAEMYFSDESLTYFAHRLRCSLGQWVKEGNCPLMHKLLYDVQLPHCVQDAYTTLAAYLSKTKENEKIVTHILEQRLNHLVEEQAVLDDSVEEADSDMFGQLSRTQAMLIYEIIGLFDESIRGRALAERHVGLLSQWARKLWHVSKQTLQTKPNGPLSGSNETPIAQPFETTNSVASWRTWILVESIRRTYLMATLTEAAFTTLKQGWAPCPGGITFTCGQGLWSAKSAKEWSALSRRQKVLYLKCIDGEDLFAEASPSEVDEFTHMVLVASFGLERFRQWDDEWSNQN